MLKISLRVPLSWVDRIDALVKVHEPPPVDPLSLTKPLPKYTRHDWLLDALRDKLEREKSQGRTELSPTPTAEGE